MFTGASVGIAIAKPDMVPDHLLAQADLALYRAKDDGESVYRFYAEDMNREAHARRELEQELRDALTNASSKSSTSLSLRRRPAASRAPRLSFVGAIPSAASFHRSSSCPSPKTRASSCPLAIGSSRKPAARHELADDTKVSINISPVQFKSGTIVESVVHALATSGLPARRLILEITETVLADADLVIETVDRLRALGVQIAMDDFGTGYSSLNYLRRFHFDKIKIDRSFIMDLTTGGESANAIMRAMVEIGKALHLEITAEGVETEELFALVRDVGCTEVQGYLIGRPMPQSAFRAFLGLDPGNEGTGEDTKPAIVSLEKVRAETELRKALAAQQADNPIVLDLSADTPAVAS